MAIFAQNSPNTSRKSGGVNNNDLTDLPTGMPDQFAIFDVVLSKRRRTWTWRVCTAEGEVVMEGSERSRPEARYSADRALFLLLMSAPYRSQPKSRSVRYTQQGPAGDPSAGSLGGIA